MPGERKTHGREEIQYMNGYKVVFTKLDSLEEYEEKVAELDEYSMLYLMMRQDNSFVYTVTNRDLELYGDKLMDDFRVCPSVASVVRRLHYGIEEMRHLDPKKLPVIPIMEYRLVPTGNVYYFDPALDPAEERHKRNLWKMHLYYLRKEGAKRRMKRLQSKQKSKGDTDDGI